MKMRNKDDKKNRKICQRALLFFSGFWFSIFFDLTLPDLTFFQGILALDMRILRIVSPSD